MNEDLAARIRALAIRHAAFELEPGLGTDLMDCDLDQALLQALIGEPLIDDQMLLERTASQMEALAAGRGALRGGYLAMAGVLRGLALPQPALGPGRR